MTSLSGTQAPAVSVPRMLRPLVEEAPTDTRIGGLGSGADGVDR